MADYRPGDTVRNPLTAQHYDLLTQASRQYHDLLAELDKAEHCGIVCHQQREDAKRHSQQISHMLATYFPQGRPQE